MSDNLEEFYQALKHGFYTLNRHLNVRLPETVNDLVGMHYAATVEYKQKRIQNELEEQKKEAVVAKRYEEIQKQYLKTGWVQGKIQKCHWRFVLAEKTDDGLKILEDTIHIRLTNANGLIWFRNKQNRNDHDKRIKANNEWVIKGRLDHRYPEERGELWLARNAPYPWGLIMEYWFWTSTVNLAAIERLIQEKTHEFLTLHGNLPKRHLHLLRWKSHDKHLEPCLELRW